ncbi:MAG: SprT-like domain-containing protein, partial [Myxococcales bacterium]|nr:SprT-like domain-containing protein [Myxococcales bacterium]
MDASPQALSVELERALLRQLADAWYQVSTSHFRGALKRPQLRLVEGRSFFAHWNRENRIISFSRPFVLETDWGSVVEVLKHEIAHQYAHEVLGAIDETDHGPAFQRICERMGIDAQASGPAPSGGPPTPESKVLKRVAAQPDTVCAGVARKPAAT